MGYIVQAGDTLWAISIRTGESVEALRMANCLENADLIYTGQSLYVPNLPLDPATATSTASTPAVKNPTISPTQTPKPTEEPSPIPTEPPPLPVSETPRATPTLAPTTDPSDGN
jgi:LysM repeat protein